MTLSHIIRSLSPRVSTSSDVATLTQTAAICERKTAILSPGAIRVGARSCLSDTEGALRGSKTLSSFIGARE